MQKDSQVISQFMLLGSEREKAASKINVGEIDPWTLYYCGNSSQGTLVCLVLTHLRVAWFGLNLV